MIILLTNLKLTSQSGTEMYVRDLALELLRRGHRPLVYAPMAAGSVVDGLRRATVPVVDRLDRIALIPDVIHGHHAHQMMAALLHFDSTPGIFVCHDYTAWHDEPPLFPRILRYVAVDHTCLDRLVCESGIPEDRTEVILNFVDLSRFRPRASLPQRPGRALVFSNLAERGGFFEEIAQACRAAGIAVDAGGVCSGQLVERPEEILGRYDLVFAKGKAALEALAVGTAVILCDKMGMGPMVSTGRLDELRRGNFGRRHLQTPVSCAAVAEQIAAYDAPDAAAVSRRVRAGAGLAGCVDQLVELYERVVGEYRSVSSDQEKERAATAAYMERLSSTEAIVDSANYKQQNEALKADHSRLLQEVATMREALSSAPSPPTTRGG